MICPKCGFDQPDDVYCAFCGISVEKYFQEKRKKRQKRYLLFVALIGVATLSIATYFISVHRIETPEQVAKYSAEKDKVQPKDIDKVQPKDIITPPKAERDRPVSDTPQAQRETDSKLQEASLRPDSGEDKRPGADEPGPTSPPDQQKAESPHKQEGETYTSAELFEKGRALDDESEAETEYYERAIKLDPKFAPAYYRLGAIYYRSANYEMADQQFAKFLKYASEADREAYSIYVYYSPSDVERLSEDKVAGEASSEEAEKETPSEAEEAEKETPSETEEGEEETPSEGEKETEEPASEETGQETSEEVMTIVKFLPVDGHVVIPVVFNGFLEARVLVDTGAGITVLSRELVQELQLEEEPGHGITLKTMALDIQAQLATLDSIQVGDLIENNFRVAISDLPSGEERKFDAILGMDFLNKYKIHIDNENRRIVLSPGKRSGF
ncbi:MAG: aspartyl protease family protein [Desulfobacteria bacterium]